MRCDSCSLSGFLALIIRDVFILELLTCVWKCEFPQVPICSKCITYGNENCIILSSNYTNRLECIFRGEKMSILVHLKGENDISRVWELDFLVFYLRELPFSLYLKFCQKVLAEPPSPRTGGTGSKSACWSSQPPPRRDGVKKCMLILLVCGDPSFTGGGRISKAGSW